VQHERRHQGDSEDDRHDHLDRAKAAGDADLGQAVGDERQSGGHQRQADEVEVLGALAGDRREHPHCRDDRDQADRQVDVEDPAPRGVVGDHAAADALQHAEGDQLGRRGGQTAQRRAGDEQHEPTMTTALIRQT
jgi:hypothetical protein